jgi:hypothetical protein
MVKKKEEKYQELQEYLESPEGETEKKEYIKSVIKLKGEEGVKESAKKLFDSFEHGAKYAEYLADKFKEEVKASSLKEEKKIDYLDQITEPWPKIYESPEGVKSLVQLKEKFDFEVETKEKEKEKIKKHGKMGGKQQ